MPAIHRLITKIAAMTLAVALFQTPLVQAQVKNGPDQTQQGSEFTLKGQGDTSVDSPGDGDSSASRTAFADKARLALALRQDYEPNPAIWRLSDDDTTIYLFGTIHILPEGFKWRSSKLDAIIEEADELVMETSEDEDDLDAMMMEMIGTIFNATAERGPLSSLVDAENRPKLEMLAEQIGMPKDFIDIMPVWLLGFFSFYDGAADFGSVDEYGVETVLGKIFKSSNKPISAIEDGNAVMAAMSAIDETAMIAELNTALSKWDGKGPLFGTPETNPSLADPIAYFADDHGWAQGKTSAMASGLSREELGDAFYDVLLVDRNRAWAEWLDDRLDAPGTVLVAVGAGHLAGPDSVQVMLRKRGLETERIR
ncbi:MAG: TraB/GumN family protein [Pseudomonadota bacterium]